MYLNACISNIALTSLTIPLFSKVLFFQGMPAHFSWKTSTEESEHLLGHTLSFFRAPAKPCWASLQLLLNHGCAVEHSHHFPAGKAQTRQTKGKLSPIEAVQPSLILPVKESKNSMGHISLQPHYKAERNSERLPQKHPLSFSRG